LNSDATKPIRVEFSVRNTGNRRGAVVPQVYLELPASTGEPSKRLIAFRKIILEAGERRRVRVCVNPTASSHPLGYWDSAKQDWTIAEGDYHIYVGNSSEDTPLSERIVVRKGTNKGRVNDDANSRNDDEESDSCHEQ